MATWYYTIDLTTNLPSTTKDWVFRVPHQEHEWQYVTFQLINENVQKEEKENTRMLYEVYIYDPEEERIAHDWDGVAKDQVSAQMKAWQSFHEIPGEEKPVEDYDFVVCELGKVRAKKEVQEVKIVEK